MNGEGGGKATGKPCAGCVGAADNKNPKGQFPDGSDHNNGYECDGNKGIGKGNPAHTGCQPQAGATETCPEGTTMVNGQCVSPQVICPQGTIMIDGTCVKPQEVTTCPEGTTMVGNVCVTPEVLTENVCPEGTTMVDGACVEPQARQDEVLNETITPAEHRPARVLGAVLPFTGASLISFFAAALALIAAGFAALGFGRKS
jgi:hypothetical protein